MLTQSLFVGVRSTQPSMSRSDHPVLSAISFGASTISAGSARWKRLSLSAQFIAAASVVLFSTMTLLAEWVSSRIENQVVQNTAISTAFYLDSLIEPQLQPLATGLVVDLASRAELDRNLSHTPLGVSIAMLTVWNLDGTVVYSTDASLIGDGPPSAIGFVKARANNIAPEYHAKAAPENTSQHVFYRDLLRVYAPVHQSGTNRVIGVIKFDQFGDALQRDLAKTRGAVYLVVGLSTLIMLGLLFLIVQQGDQTISRQRASLEKQIADKSRLLHQNEGLRLGLLTARKVSSQTTERLLRRVGADLHDGPAQLLSLALLYYDALKPVNGAGRGSTEMFETIRGLLQDSLGEMRNISADVAPPQTITVSATQTIQIAIRNHEKRTGVQVGSHIDDLGADVPMLVKTCLYRFVQEGLNNAFRHATGCDVEVRAVSVQRVLTVDVIDHGPGMTVAGPGDCAAEFNSARGLGLAGLRDRIEACQGTLEIASVAGSGFRLTAQIAVTIGQGTLS